MTNKVKISKYLFRVLLVLLFIPMLQAKFEFVKVKDLGGYAVPPSDVTLGKDNWLDGSYQGSKEKYLKHNFGFRNSLLRAEHQWAFWAYGMSRVNGLIMGKENYLYEISYINARNGTEYLGDKRLVELAYKAKEVQDTMRAMGKAFFFVIAPSKADYYPEYIPDKYVQEGEPKATNYGTFSSEMKKNGVRLLDFNAWFLSMKDTTSYPLYSKTGIHYSTYGAALAAKRIIAESETQLNKDLPDLFWENVYWDSKLKGSDDDLEKALNLAFKIPNIDMPYPAIKIEGEGKYKPKSITIGDSFYWQLVQMNIDKKVFDNGQFWYYNKESYPDKKPFATVNMEEELNKAEAVFVIMTPPNMEKYLGSFIEVLHDFYYNSKNKGENYNEKIQAKIKEIKANSEWLEAVKEKALEQNVPLEDMIYLDAKFVVEEAL